MLQTSLLRGFFMTQSFFAIACRNPGQLWRTADASASTPWRINAWAFNHRTVETQVFISAQQLPLASQGSASGSAAQCCRWSRGICLDAQGNRVQSGGG